MKTYREILKEGEQRLLLAGVENACGEAWYFFEDAFSMERMDYLLEQNRVCEKMNQIELFETYVKRRSEKHIPMQYLLGAQDFMGLTFKVTPDVLIPRQDTEVLVEEVLEKAKEKKTVLDMCTGSGCIVISLAHYGNFERCVGVDLSEGALKIAKENGKSLAPMVEFINSDLFAGVEGKYDVIVSNPPYIKTNECQNLMSEVKDFEPMLALDGHEDGLYFYRRIIKDAKNYLNPGGMLFFEIGYDQGKSVPAFMQEAGFSEIVLKQDLAGLDRVVYGKYEGGK
ncbi:MAG: peptide chain release factor N(5)-glutamine methyltransferase [Lachnospiraceae bacterium]|nr:peptide chain release factor N(5)-glutamine methyltransferase [Lachnospiraceae bacterium]